MKEVPIEGTPVEVCIDKEGFQGGWFTANIVKVLEMNEILIPYKTIRTDDNKVFLMEVVNAKQIRPSPPNLVLAESFSVTQEVDVFYIGCWWEGVIRNVLHGQRYKVYVKGTNDELLFQHSDLRPRQDWIDGTWFIASQDQKLYGTIVIVVVLNGYILLGYDSRTFRNGSLSSYIKIKMEQLTPTIAMTMAGYVNVAEQIWGHIRDEIKTNENLTVSTLAKRGKEFADHKIKDKTSAGCYIAGFEEQVIK